MGMFASKSSLPPSPPSYQAEMCAGVEGLVKGGVFLVTAVSEAVLGYLQPRATTIAQAKTKEISPPPMG